MKNKISTAEINFPQRSIISTSKAQHSKAHFLPRLINKQQQIAAIKVAHTRTRPARNAPPAASVASLFSLVLVLVDTLSTNGNRYRGRQAARQTRVSQPMLLL